VMTLGIRVLAVGNSWQVRRGDDVGSHTGRLLRELAPSRFNTP